MSKNLIIVFTRNPELGKVKTRLAKTIGNQSALNIYNYLLNHTEQTIRNTTCDKAIFYSVKIRENDIWSSNIYHKLQQKGKDLGSRMSNAFKYAFENNYEKVIIIGSDLFDLKPKHISTALNMLDKNDVVIGPAQDGGYYLLGMKKIHSNVFENKNWGTETVLKDTLKDLKHLDVFHLKELNDIDTFEDIRDNQTLKELITKNG